MGCFLLSIISCPTAAFDYSASWKLRRLSYSFNSLMPCFDKLSMTVSLKLSHHNIFSFAHSLGWPCLDELSMTSVLNLHIIAFSHLHIFLYKLFLFFINNIFFYFKMFDDKILAVDRIFSHVVFQEFGNRCFRC